MKERSGFSLLEMAVATVLLGVAVVGLVGAIGNSLSGIATAREYDWAAIVAKSTMNELLSQEPLPLGEPLRGRLGDDAGWKASAAPLVGFGTDARGRRLVRVYLEVWWDSDGHRKQIGVEGIRRVVVR